MTLCSKCGEELRTKKYRYSEIFSSIQGEGQYTGVPTVWLRFWGCNLNCQGFSQENPRDPSTWVKEYEDIDIDGIKSMEDLPVLTYGCDSSYSWAKKFSHLAHHETVSEICDKLEELMTNEFNPNGKFLHEKSEQWTHLAFTGGEPMMNQSAIVEIMEEFERRGNVPKYVTVETNGTQKMRERMESMLLRLRTSHEFGGMMSDQYGAPEWFWSISPKLSASGEPWDKAIKPIILEDYVTASRTGQLKFVVDGTDECWAEVEQAIEAFEESDVLYPVHIMPVGATLEQQENIQAKICEQTIERGYCFSPRVHCMIFGNKIGT